MFWRNATACGRAASPTMRIWSEKTADKKGHGTTITLTALLPRVVHILQSRDVWAALAEEEGAKGAGKRRPPLWHIGEIDPDNPESLKQKPSYPWHDPSDEVERFQCLIDHVSEAWRKGNHYARLEHALDNYFRMIWVLGLSLPIGYAEKHPFSLIGKDIKQTLGLVGCDDHLLHRTDDAQPLAGAIADRQCVKAILWSQGITRLRTAQARGGDTPIVFSAGQNLVEMDRLML